MEGKACKSEIDDPDAPLLLIRFWITGKLLKHIAVSLGPVPVSEFVLCNRVREIIIRGMGRQYNYVQYIHILNWL